MLAACILVTGWVGVRGHWTPVGDNAMITTFSLDTVSGEPPLLGMPTSLSIRTGDPVRHPGPLPFWITGPPAAALGAPGYGMVVGVVAIHLAALATMVVATRRMPWSAGVFAAGFATAMAVRNVGLRVFRDPFNPYLGIFSGLASLLAAWAVLSGHLWVLPVFVAIASFVAQAHVTYLPLIGSLVVLVVVAVAADHLRLPSDHPRRRLLLRRVGPLSLVVGLLCWSGPLYDQFFGTGNLWALITGGGSLDVAGWKYGWDRLIGGISPMPHWAKPRQSAGLLESPSLLKTAFGVAFLALLAGQAFWARRTRHRTLLAAVAVAGTALAAGAVLSARLPGDDRALKSPLNRMFWTPVGCMAWLVLAWGSWTIAGWALERYRPGLTDRFRVATAAPVAVALICIAAVTIGLTTGTARPTTDSSSIMFGAARVHSHAIARAVPAGSTILVRSPRTDLDNTTVAQSVISQLRLRGYEVQIQVVDDWKETWRAFQARHPTDGTHDVTIEMHGRPADSPPEGFRLLSTYDPQDPPPAFAEHRTKVLFGGGRQVSEVYIEETSR